MTGAFPPACLQTEPRQNEAERSAKSEKRMRKRSGARIQVWSQAILAAGVCDFASAGSRSSKGRSLTPQSNGARGPAALTCGRECVAGSRGLWGARGQAERLICEARTAKGQTRIGD
jgi:hypothetical protein